MSVTGTWVFLGVCVTGTVVACGVSGLQQAAVVVHIDELLQAVCAN